MQTPFTFDSLKANHLVVAVHKYGFFLCLRGSCRIMLGGRQYSIQRNSLCIYTPNTYFRILERSADLDGILEEDRVGAYYPVVSSIPVRDRLRMRRNPVVALDDSQAQEIVCLSEIIAAGAACPPEPPNALRNECLRYLRYALCLKVCELYFANEPLESIPQDRGDLIFNDFLVSAHENCHRFRTVAFYAAEQKLSPYYFSKIIMAKSGRRASEWIEEITMTAARRMLDSPALSIKEIAEQLNFPDQSVFGRYFRRQEGISPGQYRAKLSADKTTRQH